MKCFLHIGTEKTGSTLIQDWLHINRNALLNNRIFLPTKMGGNNHYLLPAFFQSNSDNWNKNIIRAFARKNAVEELDDRLWKDKFITLASKEIELNQQHCDVAIITSEHFHRRIKSAFDINAVKYLLQNIFDEVYVVCYFREQFELALSLYSTALRGGSKATIQEFTRNVVPTNDYYNYFEIANNYATAFGKENCIFRIYDRENFIGNDIRKDFMKAINKTISFDNVVKAAKKIGIHDFIMSLPGGYNYNVKERGVMISQGQRQLISFLRAYLKNPSILILDEATSSIDSNSEELIQSAILKITENKTSIIIAHRLSTILNSDRILVMDSGKLVEYGSHLELINKKKGYYKNLYEIQFKSSEIKPVQLQS